VPRTDHLGVPGDTRSRALVTGGTSLDAIYARVAKALADRGCGGTLLDVGCGHGSLWAWLQSRFTSYIGIDLIAYGRFPRGQRRVLADFQAAGIPLRSNCADAVVALEVIEHLENPRAFVRELTRLVRPGGWIAVTTPNQRSALSILTLIVRGRFAAFQDTDYPAHVTALLEVDLRRIASECGLEDVAVEFTSVGRMPLTARHYPRRLSRRFPTALSDNMLLVARTPGA
jgi:2-polyprenyl-3-methyl-5-hydroxy-6-metoxy-1,4-benzoquinol methylase